MIANKDLELSFDGTSYYDESKEYPVESIGGCMKVIEDNYNDLQRITCPHCESVLEYDEWDIFHANGLEDKLNMTCCLCGGKIKLTAGK